MDIPLAIKVEGKKYMWDGAQYDTEDQAHETGGAYQKDGFEIHVSKNTDKYLIYSRRVANIQTEES